MLPKDPISTLFVVVLGAEGGVLLAALAVLLLRRGPVVDRPLRRRLIRRFDALAARPAASTGAVFALALVLCAALALVHRPIPRIHDEFAYLLAADTFARGRLTNPTPPAWEHFESEHILVRPSYASKYPPAQGLVLAAGQAVFGSPLVGAWIGAAAASAAIAWMLRAWLPARWALAGGLVAATHPGLLAWWGHSYWGGSLAALGGALLFGATRRLVTAPRWLDGFLLGAGLAILANSRPYEGLVAAAAAGAMLLAGLARRGWPACKRVMTTAGAPAAAVLAAAAAWGAYYNFRVTGCATTMPYRVHWAQYCATPLFVFQDKPPAPAYRDRKLRDFHEGWELEPWKKQQGAYGFAQGAFRKVLMAWGFYFGPPLTVGLLGLWPAPRRIRRAPPRRDPWVGAAAAACAWSLGMSVVCVWFHAFYIAPIMGLLLFLAVEGFRRVRVHGDRGRRLVAAALVAHASSVITVFVALPILAPPTDWSARRDQIQRSLEARGGRHLVIVRHGSRYEPLQEWVYNLADLDSAPVVWARELESQSIPALLAAFGDRTPWLVEAYLPDKALPVLEPYPVLPSWLHAPAMSLPLGPVPAVAAAAAKGARPSFVVAAVSGSPDLRLLRRVGQGDPTVEPVPLPSAVSRLAVVDLDGDGEPDVAALSATSSAVFVVRVPAHGPAGLSAVVPLPGPGRDLSVLARTGREPVLVAAVAGAEPGVAMVELGQDGAVATTNVPLEGVEAVGIAALTASEPPVIAALVPGTRRVHFAVPGDARHSLDGLEWTTGRDPTAVRFADLGGAGVPQVVVLCGGDDRAMVLHRRPDGAWATIQLRTGSAPAAVAAGDLDGDGRPDLCVATRFGHGLTIFRNAGGLRFDAPAAVTLGGTTWFHTKSLSLAAADLDGDGVDDLVIGTEAGCEVLLSSRGGGQARLDKTAAAAPISGE
jgi:hypothetical protein